MFLMTFKVWFATAVVLWAFGVSSVFFSETWWQFAVCWLPSITFSLFTYPDRKLLVDARLAPVREDPDSYAD